MKHWHEALAAIPINIELGSILGAVVLAAGTYFGLRKKKFKETSHAIGMEKSIHVRHILNKTVLSIPGARIASIGIVRNGGRAADLTEPKTLQILESSDFSTWELFNEPFQMEPELKAIHNNMIDRSGVYDFKASQLQAEITKQWYRDNSLTQSSAHLIGINDEEGYSVVMYVNYGHEFIPYPDANKLLLAFTRELKDTYSSKPGTFRRRNKLIV